MNGDSLGRRSGRSPLTRAPLAYCFAIAGTVLDVATVIVSGLNAVSAQQAIAMALPAGLITAGGVIAVLLPDPWAAWRRGFQHGCEAAIQCEQPRARPAIPVKSARHARLSI
jgi:hypothetical protein